MNIDSIHSGIVLDHIKAGRGMDVYRFLKLDELDCPVAYIRNVRSGVLGKKDIIKIDSVIDVDLDVLGYIDPGITVNIIKDGQVAEKKKLSLPEHLINVIICKNPRCVTTVEGALDQHFILKDRSRGIYRCMFCDAERKSKALR
ncbi:MAG: aspartate carbamoyltransferase regulatory subunit [Clostridiales bacterium]|nr:aspartate carbamoyltransferase regulatory subunit [Clostridiales bacterium]